MLECHSINHSDTACVDMHLYLYLWKSMLLKQADHSEVCKELREGSVLTAAAGERW